MEFSSQAKTENHTVFLEKSSKQQPFVFLIGKTLDSSTMKAKIVRDKQSHVWHPAT